MSSLELILSQLKQAYPDVNFQLDGDGCHFQITAIGEIFSGLNKLKRQQLLNKVLAPLIADGTIHAVNYRLYTTEEYQQQ